MFEQVNKYKSKGLLLDTNLFVLLIIGMIDPKKVSSNKRTMKYTTEDFNLLVRLLDQFRKIIVTPHILAETSNLIDVYNNEMKSTPFLILNQLLLKQKNFTEEHVPAIEVCDLQAFGLYGLTDTALLEVAKNNYLILTDDIKLSGFATKHGIDVINFNHIRDMSWQL